MIGLALRLTALMTATLLLVVLTLVGAFYVQRTPEDGGGLRLLLPDRTSAIVELLEATPPAQRGRVLRAINTIDFRVGLRAGPLGNDDGDVRFPLLTSLIHRSLVSIGERRVKINADTHAPSPRIGALLGNDDGDGPLHIAVELRDGSVAEIQVRGDVLRRALRWPFVAAVMLLLGAIGLAALWALRAQIRPLEALAREVERIGTADEGAALRESGAREVRQLVLAFNRMRDRLQRLIEGRTRMLAAISHDLGTYLTRLRLRIESIADDEQRQRAEKDLHDMHQLLRDTLALARADRSVEALNETVVDLVPLAEREVREHQDAGADVVLVAPADLAVAGHPLSLARVLANLIGNAIRHAGSAEITIRRDGGFAELIVDDRGPGIPADEREAALEPFYRRDAARTIDDGGSGLGLAIVADIVQRHHGELRLEDRPGGGLRVRVRLRASQS